MKNIVAINAGPRRGWNTDLLVQEAARGALSAGAAVETVDLYRLPPYTGCISCFGCKRPQTLGRCVCKDGLSPVLEKIAGADGLIMGSPIYLGQITAQARALYERLIFPYITYKTEPKTYANRKMPVLFIVTSNCPAEMYGATGYDAMVEGYRKTFAGTFGEAKVLIAGDTLQVDDYAPFGWTMFDPEKKKARRETVFPGELAEAFRMGAEMAAE